MIRHLGPYMVLPLTAGLIQFAVLSLSGKYTGGTRHNTVGLAAYLLCLCLSFAFFIHRFGTHAGLSDAFRSVGFSCLPLMVTFGLRVAKYGRTEFLDDSNSPKPIDSKAWPPPPETRPRVDLKSADRSYLVIQWNVDPEFVRSVFVDGQQLPSDAMGRSIELFPGTHSIRASLGADSSNDLEVAIATGESVSLEVGRQSQFRRLRTPPYYLGRVGNLDAVIVQPGPYFWARTLLLPITGIVIGWGMERAGATRASLIAIEFGSVIFGIIALHNDLADERRIIKKLAEDKSTVVANSLCEREVDPDGHR